VSALFQLQEHFAAEAAADPDMSDYMGDLAQEAAALADRLQVLGEPNDVGGRGASDAHDEL